MKEDKSCVVVCRHEKLSQSSVKAFNEKIDDDYRVNMILDNLPVAMRIPSDNSVYDRGFRVGVKDSLEKGSTEHKYFIHNHLSFKVQYHIDGVSETSRIVGFDVTPYSVKHKYDGAWDGEKTKLTTCNPNDKESTKQRDPQELVADEELIFSYDIKFLPSDVKWASRWDTYLLMGDDQIHWFSIINSLMIVLFLSGMVAMIMLRTLHRDISKYNELESQEEAQEETGWKLVHGDVFRPPSHAGLLCVYVGTGVQFLGMTVVTMIFAMLGFLSPANRGGLMTAMLLLWVFMGLFAGYSSSRMYKMFKGTDWKTNTLKTAFLFPGTIFVVFFILNALIWGEKSSGAIPFGTMFALVCLWFGISVPLVFVGSYFGFKKPAVEDPVRTNKIPRQIPEQAWYMRPVFSILIGGILPFGAVFIELFFILTSIWLHQFYYIFGFLFIVFLILMVTCAEITIVLCYFQLCSEDYHWWWRAYLTAGSSALYLFLYAAYYFFAKLDITKVVSGILYFGYMVMISYSFFVLTGTIGFYACYWFVRTIYASVKID
jgi:transmembrane 9 superfamily protein 2/4